MRSAKKLENHLHALAVYFMYFNFVRILKTLKQTPAMAAGVADRLWSVEDMVAIIEEREARKVAAKKGRAIL